MASYQITSNGKYDWSSKSNGERFLVTVKENLDAVQLILDNKANVLFLENNHHVVLTTKQACRIAFVNAAHHCNIKAPFYCQIFLGENAFENKVVVADKSTIVLFPGSKNNYIHARKTNYIVDRSYGAITQNKIISDGLSYLIIPNAYTSQESMVFWRGLQAFYHYDITNYQAAQQHLASYAQKLDGDFVVWTDSNTQQHYLSVTSNNTVQHILLHQRICPNVYEFQGKLDLHELQTTSSTAVMLEDAHEACIKHQPPGCFYFAPTSINKNSLKHVTFYYVASNGELKHQDLNTQSPNYQQTKPNTHELCGLIPFISHPNFHFLSENDTYQLVQRAAGTALAFCPHQRDDRITLFYKNNQSAIFRTSLPIAEDGITIYFKDAKINIDNMLLLKSAYDLNFLIMLLKTEHLQCTERVTNSNLSRSSHNASTAEPSKPVGTTAGIQLYMKSLVDSRSPQDVYQAAPTRQAFAQLQYQKFTHYAPKNYQASLAKMGETLSNTFEQCLKKFGGKAYHELSKGQQKDLQRTAAESVDANTKQQLQFILSKFEENALCNEAIKEQISLIENRNHILQLSLEQQQKEFQAFKDKMNPIYQEYIHAKAVAQEKTRFTVS